MSKSPNTYHIFRLDYSQTDHEMIIVEAESRAAAEKWLMRHGSSGPRYLSYYGTSSIVKAGIIA